MSNNIGALGKGERWELRIHRAAFLSGWYVRRNVNLRERVRGTPQTMAEVDILGLDYDPTLALHLLVGECKDRKGNAKEADRVVWLLGLSKLLHADQVVLAKPILSDGTYLWSRPLGVMLWDEATITAIEKEAGLKADEGYVGSFRPTSQPDMERLRKTGPETAQLRKGWDYVTNTFWYEREATRIRRLHAYFALLQQHGGGLTDPDQDRAAAEGVLALVAAALGAAAQLRATSPGRGRVALLDDLSSGVAPADELRDIAARADEYYRDALQRTLRNIGRGDTRIDIPRLADQVGRPPSWTDDFADLARKLGATPAVASALLRFSDLVLIEHIVHREKVPTVFISSVPHPHVELLRLLQLAVLFVERVWGFKLPLLTRVLGLGIDDLYTPQADQASMEGPYVKATEAQPPSSAATASKPNDGHSSLPTA